MFTFFMSRFAASFLALVTFVVLPRMMSPDDYGYLNIVVQSGTTAFALFLGWVPSSMVRFHKSTTMEGMSTSWLLGSAAAAASGIAASLALWLLIWGGTTDLPVVAVAAFGFGHGLNEIGLAGLRAYGQAPRFAVCVLFRPVFGLILALLFVSMGGAPQMVAFGLGAAAGLSGLWAILWVLKRSPPAVPGWSELLRLVRFGVPLAVVGAGASFTLLMTQSALLTHEGLQVVGTFTAAQSLAMRGLSMPMILLGRTISPNIYEAFENDGHDSSDPEMERYASFLLLGSIPILIVMAVGAMPVSYVLFNASYRDAVAGFLPWVAFAAFVGGLQGGYLSFVFTLSEKTWAQLLLMVWTLGAHALITYVLVIRFGGPGAAYATVISAAIGFASYAIAGSFVRPLKLPWAELRKQGIAILCAIPFAFLTLREENVLIAICFLVLCLCAYFLALFFLRQLAVKVVIKRVRSAFKRHKGPR